MRKKPLHRLLLNSASAAALAAATLLWPVSALAQPVGGGLDGSGRPEGSATAATGPIRLREPAVEVALPPAAIPVAKAPTRPGEFETLVGLPRFGADLVNEFATSGADFSPIVPPEYVIQSGDELQVSIWGSVDADLRLTVDRSGRVTLPRIGPVMVAGVRYSALQELLTRRVAQVFKSFELSVSLGRLRGIRVLVTGFVERPGAYAVAGLSTVMNAVMRAGGPAAAGSYRNIELRRGEKTVGTFDLYDLILRGDRSGDRLVQPEDVIHVREAGTQVALRGSVNKQAVFELKPGETWRDLLRMAGGFSPVADRTRIALERLEDRNSRRVAQLPLPASESTELMNGDVVRVFSTVEASLSVQRQNKRIRVEGEVLSPGDFVLPPESTLDDALRAAGGLTSAAYLYGTQFNRESVRLSQQENYDRALRELESDITRTAAARRVSSSEDAVALNAQAAASARLIERLRALQPSGRVVLQLMPDSTALPPLALEDGDRLFVPPRPTTVGVFGSVFNAGSYLYSTGRQLDDYLRLAGGPTKGADEDSLFVLRINGQVVSRRQDRTWFNRTDKVGGMVAEPGDTVFVPEELDRSTFVQSAKDWTQILYQFGIGIAGIRSTLR